MSPRLRTWLARTVPFLAVALFALAITVLRRELAAHHYSEIVGHLRSLSRETLLGAIGLTILGYGILTRYDALAMDYVGRKVQPHKIIIASFTAYALSQTLGFAMFTGGAVRYRFWSSWGLSASEIARAVGFAGLTLWLGAVALTGLALLVEPGALSGVTASHPILFGMIGAMLLLAVVGYLLVALLRREPVSVLGWSFEIPLPLVAFEQLLLSCVDWALAAAVLYLLLPATPGLSFPAFIGLFVLAQVAGLVSHVPGGLGVFDTLIVLALEPFASTATVLGALVAYRAIYYLLPFLIGVILLVGTEAIRQKTHLQSVGRWTGRWLQGVTPYLLALLTLMAGVLLLISGATPGVPSRLQWLGQVLPLSVIELSHFIGSMAGMALVILAWGLSRRLDAAYYASLILMVVGIGASLLKGGDYEEAMLLTGITLAMLPSRRRFFRRTRLTSEPLSIEWIITVLLVIVAVVAIGEFRYRHVAYAGDLWWRFELHGNAPRFLRATVGAFVVLAGFGVLRLMAPARPEPELPTAEELARAEALVAQGPTALSNVALTGDKSLLWSEEGEAFIAYGVSGKCWVAMGDPVGKADQAVELAWEFRALAHQHAGWTVFYEVGREHLPLYIDLGLTLSKLGEEARVPLTTFSLDGSSRRGLRQTCRRLERANATFEIVPREAVPALLPELERVSNDWLASKRTREKGFSLGGFDPAYLRRFRHAIIRRDGQIVAFANLWETAGREEVSLDLMRHSADAPDDVMEFLFTMLFLHCREEGHHWFNLGMAPLSGLETRSLAPLWQRVGALVYGHGERFYNFRGVRNFKDKFDPVWTPRYLVSPGGLALPRILTSVAALISDGWRGVVTK